MSPQDQRHKSRLINTANGTYYTKPAEIQPGIQIRNAKLGRQQILCHHLGVLPVVREQKPEVLVKIQTIKRKQGKCGGEGGSIKGRRFTFTRFLRHNCAPQCPYSTRWSKGISAFKLNIALVDYFL